MPARYVRWKKFTIESKGKPEQKFEAAFGTTFRISIPYPGKQAKTSYRFFSRKLSKLKIKKPFAHVSRKYVLIYFYRPSTKIFNW
jgi:hypothetical protein